MPVASMLKLSGTVRADPTRPSPAVLSGWLTGASAATLGGTVSAEVRQSYDGETSGDFSGTIYTGVRVELAGVDVTGDLVGAVDVSDSIDTHLKEAKFALVGPDYSPMVTQTTWTRTPCKVFFRQGPPGGVLEKLELNGFVETCAPSGDGAYQITAVDAGLLFNRDTVCLQIAPHFGLTRGQICEAMAAAAGVEATDIPAGAPYAKPFESAGGRLYELLKAFGEPEGWHWRHRADGTLEAYVPALKDDPEPPDHRWTVDDLLARPRLEPPRDVPSRWIARGRQAVLVDELGLTTELLEVEVRDVYAPKVATLKQDAAGNITPVSVATQAVDRVVSRICDQVTRRGDRVLRQSTTEYAWANPAAGKWTTGAGGLGGGPVGDLGLYYLEAWIDGDGAYRLWNRERFMRVGRRDQDFDYDDDGNLTGIRVVTYAPSRRRRGVRSNASTVADVPGTDVGDDDVSYARDNSGSIEPFRIDSIQEASYSYDPTSGALVLEVLESTTPTSPRATVDPAEFNHVLSDGRGQKDVEAFLQRSSRLERQHLVDGSGRLRGQIDRPWAFQVTPVVGGIFDFGDFVANARESTFSRLPAKGRELQVLDDDSYIEVTYEGGERTEVRRIGQPPLPTYLKSPWTTLVQQALEVVIDDPVLEAWFGRESRFINSDYAQSSLELQGMVHRQLGRLLAYKGSVERLETHADLGDTVVLEDSEQSIAHRCLIVARSRRRVPATGEATAVYALEAPL